MLIYICKIYFLEAEWNSLLGLLIINLPDQYGNEILFKFKKKTA